MRRELHGYCDPPSTVKVKSSLLTMYSLKGLELTKNVVIKMSKKKEQGKIETSYERT